jgi:predicted kinase
VLHVGDLLDPRETDALSTEAVSVRDVGYVVVSGPPGSGKSTVARGLAARLGLPLLAHDDIKESLADSLGLGDEEWSFALGRAAMDVLFVVAPQLDGAVLEGWWRDDRRNRLLALGGPFVEIFCTCDPDVVEQRARKRVAERERHPIHRDVINPGVLGQLRSMADSVEPLDLGGPLLRIDTTNEVDVDALADAIAH